MEERGRGLGPAKPAKPSPNRYFYFNSLYIVITHVLYDTTFFAFHTERIDEYESTTICIAYR
jgi:hypothetical protein